MSTNRPGEQETTGAASSHDQSPDGPSAVDRFRLRMLQWSNPVEYVNNMYGCHPGDDGTDYFKVVFGK